MTNLRRKIPAGLAVLLAFVFVFAAAEKCSAQIRVELSLKRKLYLIYEPMMAVVSIENLSGRPLVLDNAGDNRWFGFTIESEDGRPVAPFNPDYELEPVAIAPGEKLSRAVNITPLFPLQEFGLYSIKATIYSAAFGKFFSSAPATVQICDGQVLWQEVLGLPGESGPPLLRTVTLLSHDWTRSTRLYARVEDKERGKIYATHELGPLLGAGRLDVLIDRRNEVHVLQNSAPKEFIYSHLGLSGELFSRQVYLNSGSSPALVKDQAGEVQVVGGRVYKPGEEEEAAKAADKAGDRPVPLPGS